MGNKLNLIKNNTPFKERKDLEWVNEFYQFLQGKSIPENITIAKAHQPKMSNNKAMTIIWYLQEHFAVIPDNIEKCDVCKELFDADNEGIYWEAKGKHFCESCEYLVPSNYNK